MKKLISICICCYNEEDNVLPMAGEITSIMQMMEKYDYEILFSDNCSKDKTVERLKAIAKNDRHIKVIVNNRNFGTRKSGINCMRRAKGDAVISLPCDFQDPPEMIPILIEKWELGAKIVCGQKTSSEENKIKYYARSLFYKIIDNFSDVKQYPHVAGIMLNDREIVNMVLDCGIEMAYRNLIAELGYIPVLVPYEQKKRKTGKSSYNLLRYLDFALSSMVTTSTIPIRIATIMGSIMSCCSFLIGLIYLIYKLIYWKAFSVGMAPVIVGIFFLGSAQIFFIGLIGEYIIILLQRTSALPMIVEKELINFDEEIQ